MKTVSVLTMHDASDGRVFERQVISLANAGYKVYFVTQHRYHTPKEYPNVEVQALGMPKNRLHWPWFLVCLYRVAKNFRTDYVHIHDPVLIPIAILLKLKNNSKIIYDIHENYITVQRLWIPKLLRKPIPLIYRLFERIVLLYFDALVLAADDLADYYNHKNTIVVNNFPRIETISQIVKQSLNTEPRGDRTEVPFRGVYIGVLTKKRAIVELIEAFEYLNEGINPPKYVLLLGGNFTEKDLESLVLQKAEEQNFIEYLGYLTLDEMLKNFANSDIGFICFHSDPNAFFSTYRSNKFFQYMALGVPTIVSDYPMWKEAVERIGCGIAVNAENPLSIAKAVKYLAENPEERKKMGQNGREASLEEYNWEQEAKKLLNLYENL